MCVCVCVVEVRERERERERDDGQTPVGKQQCIEFLFLNIFLQKREREKGVGCRITFLLVAQSREKSH